jgi:hypothetical protein
MSVAEMSSLKKQRERERENCVVGTEPRTLFINKSIMAVYEIMRVKTKCFWIKCNRKEICIHCMISENFVAQQTAV